MKITILTLFPEMFEVFNHSIVNRARTNKIIEINLVNIRDFSYNKHKKVDDYPFGGGAGMLMSIEPIYNAISSVKKSSSDKVIYLGPRGKNFNQSSAQSLCNLSHLIFLCGHYEGIDERCYSFIDEEISIGDFILTGGEMAAIPIIDSIVRLIPSVIKKESLENESFSNNFMEYPQYTRPREFMGMGVPDILLSGNHEEISKWRSEKSLEVTLKYKSYLLNRENCK